MLTAIGTPPWTRDDMRSKLEEFIGIYERRPIQDNSGGMSSSHLFLLWYVLRCLNPRVVIESGVWRGQGTWFIERACPDAEVYCIDLNWKHLMYRSQRAKYLSRDFELHDWSHVPKEETVLFFDDHVNAFERCKAMKALGFRHLLFEDNYAPMGGSDVYSLKMAFMHSGNKVPHSLRAIAGRLIGTRSDRTVSPNTADAQRLREIVEVYQELPPIFKLDRTRWGDLWTDERYPTPEPLLLAVERPYQQRYFDEAKWYTWMCYVRLKP